MRRNGSPHALPVAERRTGAPEVRAQRVESSGEGVEDAERACHLQDHVETDGGVAVLELAQGVAGDVRALGDLLRGEAEDLAPAGEVVADLLGGVDDLGR